MNKCFKTKSNKMDRNVSTSSDSHLDLFVSISKNLSILIALSVLLLMFVLICIILRLFAKARFRDDNRSIFAEPKKFELAKAQERKMSQLSQLSSSLTSSVPPLPHHHYHSHNHHHSHHLQQDHHHHHHPHNRHHHHHHHRSMPSIIFDANPGVNDLNVTSFLDKSIQKSSRIVSSFDQSNSILNGTIHLISIN
ncbi:hypothetical protein SSS_02303 [Sarcoptes scabiei]|uniref:Uncharacterized protein n=1 Tax=Sarcoptes scabiei TaxID=52283 RepID=A0A834V8P4_SARSC|nr:hypothetical protein SSS_02303 [Sarcoptes scabiei]